MPLVRAAVATRTPLTTALQVPIAWVTSAIPMAALCLALAIKRIWDRQPIGLGQWVAASWPLLAFLIAGVSNVGLRIGMGRMRPPVEFIQAALLDIPAWWQRFAFPSGHATASMVAFGALIVLTWRTRYRWIAVVVGAMMIAGTGYGRVYLGVHWPSDVLAGYALGLASLNLALGIAASARRASQSAIQ